MAEKLTPREAIAELRKLHKQLGTGDLSDAGFARWASIILARVEDEPAEFCEWTEEDIAKGVCPHCGRPVRVKGGGDDE